MNYQNEITDAKRLLQDGRYLLCSMQCGRITEEVLKDLFNVFLKKAEVHEFEIVTKQLAICKKRAVENLTLGEIRNIYEKTNAFYKLSKHFSANIKEVNLIDLKRIVIIRNKAQHNGYEDLEEDTVADAHIIFGSVLKLLRCFRFISRERSISIAKGPTKTEYEPKTTETPVEKPESINVCMNKSSGKYFIYIKDSGSNNVLLVTPDSKILSLKRELFDKIEEKDKKELLSKQLVSNEQMRKYREFIEGYSKGGDRVSPIEGAVYEYRIHGAVAKLIVKNKMYVVLKDSTAVRETKKSFPVSFQRKRQHLIDNEKLVLYPSKNLYVFTDDVEFKSPSAASTFVSGTSTNGWLCFGMNKVKGDILK